MDQKLKTTTSARRRWLLLVLVAGLGVLGISQVRLTTGRYYAESPVVRWKFAIYTGECDDETGCHFVKMAGTGLLEYVGLKAIPRLDAETTSPPAITDTLASPRLSRPPPATGRTSQDVP